ncbi:MAG: ferrochelatase [Thermodesulfobacteriota bacterium]
MAENGKKAVILLAFGGADSLENVEPFIRNVLSPRTPSPELIETTKERYQLIGGASPLLAITMDQARALAGRLNRERKEPITVYVGMRNWHPYIKDTLREMKDDGVKKAIAVIMAPHATEASTGGYLQDVEEALKETGGLPEVEFVGPWHTNPTFLEAVVGNMQTAFTSFYRLREKEKIRVIFTAHSLPKRILEGDPYVSLINETVEVINDMFTGLDSTIAFQSKGGGPGEWLGPSVEEAIEEAKKDGKVGVVIVPVGFVADHVETLYDIDILFYEKARSLGLTFSRAPSLNALDSFIKALSEVVTPYLDS